MGKLCPQDESGRNRDGIVLCERKISPSVLNANRKSEVPCGVAEYTIQFVRYDDLFGSFFSALNSREVIGRGFLSGLCRSARHQNCIPLLRVMWYFYLTYPYHDKGKDGPSLHGMQHRLWTTDRVIAEQIQEHSNTQFRWFPKMLEFPPGTRKSRFCQLEGGTSPWMYNKSVETASRMRRKDNRRTA